MVHEAVARRDREAEGTHQMRGNHRHRTALAHEPAHLAERAVLERPDAAVQGFEAVGRRAAGEVAAIDDGHRGAT